MSKVIDKIKQNMQELFIIKDYLCRETNKTEDGDKTERNKQ